MSLAPLRNFRLRTVALVATLAVSCSSGSRGNTPSVTSVVPAAANSSEQPGTPTTLRSVPEGGPAPGVSRPAGETFATPATIPADCSTDVTSDLAAWIASVPDDAVLSLPEGACYRIDDTLSIEQRTSLRLEGHGATLKAGTEGDRTRAHLRIRQSSNVTVHDLIVRGANPRAGVAEEAYQADREAQHAFEILASEGVLLDDVQAYDVFGDFVYIGGSVRLSKQVTVRNSRFERNGRQGVAVTNAEDVVVEGNFIAEVRRSLFDLEPNSNKGRARRIQLLANRTGAAHNFWLASKGVGAEVGDVTIRGNVMEAPSGGLMWVRTPEGLPPRTGFTIDDNTLLARNTVSDEGSVGAFFFQNCADVSITGNRVQFETNQRMPAVELRSSSRVTVSGNDFDGSAEGVIADVGSTDVSGD